MAVVCIDLVQKQIMKIIKSSQRVKHLVRKALEAVENNPASFELLSEVPTDLVADKNVSVRKVAIKHQKHEFRLLFLHRVREDGEELVDFFYVHPRKDDYRSLDWDVVKEFLLED